MKMGPKIATLFATAALLIASCSHNKNLTAGPMPEGASFAGVWQSPQYGSMHLCQTGDALIGDYLRDDRAGRIQGEVVGDIAKFTWEDSRELVRDKPSSTKGLGYFRLTVGDDGAEYLQGEWGIDDHNTGGGPWNAVKLKKRSPDRCLPMDRRSEDARESSNTDDWDKP